MSESVGLKELLRRKIDQMNANPPCFGQFRFGESYGERECNTCPHIDPCTEQTAERIRAKEMAHLSSVDLRAPGALQQFESVLKSHAGTTPVLIEATTASGIGRLSINGGRGLRVDAALPGLLRSLPGVQAVNVHLGKPWLH